MAKTEFSFLALVAVAILPAVHCQCSALNGIQLTAEVMELKRQLAVCQGSGKCPPQPHIHKVAFAVQFRNDDVNNGIALGHQSTLRFDNVITNLGNAYNPLTGIFTAPVAGLYVFTLTSMSTNGQDPASLAIVKQGTDLAWTWGDGKQDYADQSGKTLPTYMDEGDQVWVAQRVGNAIRGDWWTTFTGFLVQADQQ